MSALAEILLRSGFAVSGSDLQLSPVTDRLSGLGARIESGHDARHVGDAQVLVVTSAADKANPEVMEARRRGIPVVSRGELLAELMRPRFGVAVAGSHGKTTTTSMIAEVLIHAGLDPTVVVGGRLASLGSNARLGQSDYFVAESDESDGSFLLLSPVISVVTNIDREHLDHYRSISEIREAFLQFANKTSFYGAVVACLDDPNVREILPSIRRRVLTYGRSAEAEFVVREESSDHLAVGFSIQRRSLDVGRFRLAVPGSHNILNAAAAIAVGLELGVDIERIREGLAGFRGVGRRFEIRGEAAGITVADDYGHHPTEIAATLAAARTCRYSRIHVIFQPHRYTRTQALMDEFSTCFKAADAVYVLDIYAASEKPIEGVTGKALSERIPGARYAGTIDEAVNMALASVREGDLVLTQGAGNVWQAGDRILSRLQEKV